MAKCWGCGKKGFFLRVGSDGLCKTCKEKKARYNAVMGATVYVYGKGRVYHKTPFCSDSRSEPQAISEKFATIQGLTRCRKCW